MQRVTCCVFTLLLLLTDMQLNIFPSSSTARLNLQRVYASPAPVEASTFQRLFDTLPLSFEANCGQCDPTVKFISRGPGGFMLLAPNEVVLSTQSDSTQPSPVHDPESQPLNSEPKTPSVARLKLIGANQTAKAVGVEALPGTVNYFLGNDPHAWRTGLATYAKAKFEAVYPGIDLVYYGSQQQLEYDFVVAPGANPNLIAFDFERSSTVGLDTQGDLVLEAGVGKSICQRKPVVYQEVNGVRREISGSYLLKENHRVSFQIGSYDRRLPLVIDPIVMFSAFFAGGGRDFANGIAVDAAGNVYVGGATYSINFLTVKALQSTIGNATSCGFVAKFNPAGSLVYSTYLGGTVANLVNSLAVDPAGNAYVTGWTSSSDFPTAKPIQAAFGGGKSDAFLAKLNSTGSTLVYSTFLGGKDEDIGRRIAVDKSGNASVVGTTKSINFPVANPFQAAYGGGFSDAFVAKVNSSGSALAYSTYLGGSNDTEETDDQNRRTFGEQGFGIAVDTSGNTYVTGRTNATNFPTVKPFQSASGGNDDTFLAKFNATGSLVYATYFGGNSNDGGYSTAVDAAGNIYLAGWTGSDNFPTAKPLQPKKSKQGDAFVAKFDPTGGTLLYSTHLGGNQGNYQDLIVGEWASCIVVDTAGNAYITGSTYSTDFPTVNPIQPAFGGGKKDAFLVKVDPTGGALVFSTCLGGSGDEGSNALALDASGNVYVAGYTTSSNFNTSKKPVQATLGGEQDAFVVKVSPTGSTLAFATYLGGSLSDDTGLLKVVVKSEQLQAEITPRQVELILDCSGSMKERVKGRTKMDVAKEVLTNVINSLPDDIEVGLRLFGHRRRKDCSDLELAIPFAKINKKELIAKVQAITPLGETPLAEALKAVIQDVQGVKGDKIIIVVTDGREECGGDPVEEAKKLRQQGLQVKVDVVGFAIGEPIALHQLDEIATAGGGQHFKASNADELTQSLKGAFQAHYEVRDKADKPVASGVVGEQPIKVPEGVYRVVISATPPIEIKNVNIIIRKSTEVTITKEGNQINSQVKVQ